MLKEETLKNTTQIMPFIGADRSEVDASKVTQKVIDEE